jgi:TatD DNase family protein
MLIDTHCHLDFPTFDGWRDQVIERARRAGVGAIVVPGVSARYWARVLELCGSATDAVHLYPALGMHPYFMQEHRSEHLSLLKRQVEKYRERLVAIGEIGLDFQLEHYDETAQTELLVEQLKIAKAAELPVLLHVRKAHDQVLKQLRRLNLPRGGIVHAFSGSEQQAQEYVKLGFKLGFGGAVTYERATKLRRFAQQFPLGWIVLETDAPDMPLSGWRDQPNEPFKVAEVAQTLTDLRQIELNDLIAQTADNACALLSLTCCKSSR